MDFDKARFNMVEQQVRPWDVLSNDVLEVMSTVPREAFTPEAYKNLAYADTRIPLGSHDDHDSFMLNPVIEGRILQHLAITSNCTVLEIGTGTGYLTACMAKLGNHVDTVDIHEELSETAEKNLASLNITNVNFSTGDASKGWSQKPAYDAIAITASMPSMPESYKKLLKVGGRLFVIVGEAPAMQAYLVTRISDTKWETEELFETSVCAIENSGTEEPFIF